MKNFYKNKVVLITGHTGFKGAWLSIMMYLLGARVIGISLNPKKKLNLYNLIKKFFYKDYIFDLTDKKKLYKIIYNHRPNFIFHLAAQALVIESYKNPYYTFQNNIITTLNLLEIIRSINFKLTCVFITSDKVYKNFELNYGYKENSHLGGIDPYSASKTSIETIIDSYKKSFLLYKNNIKLSVARAGNVIGGGDWSDNRLIPDAIQSWVKGRKFNLRNPNSTRPWQHVIEPLFGYIVLAYNLNKKKEINGEILNFGPTKKNSVTVKKVIEILSMDWYGKNYKSYYKLIKNKNYKETNSLILNSSKAKLLLNWKCNLNYKQSISMTSKWYLVYYYDNKNILNYTIQQIQEYIDNHGK